MATYNCLHRQKNFLLGEGERVVVVRWSLQLSLLRLIQAPNVGMIKRVMVRTRQKYKSRKEEEAVGGQKVQLGTRIVKN